jgi:hypothetical protein
MRSGALPRVVNFRSELSLRVVEGSEFVFLVVFIDLVLPPLDDAGDDFLITPCQLFENREGDQPFVFLALLNQGMKATFAPID